MKNCNHKSRPVLSHGTQVILGVGARVLGLSFIVMLSKKQERFAKTVTIQLTHIDRVRHSAIYFYLSVAL